MTENDWVPGRMKDPPVLTEPAEGTPVQARSRRAGAGASRAGAGSAGEGRAGAPQGQEQGLVGQEAAPQGREQVGARAGEEVQAEPQGLEKLAPRSVDAIISACGPHHLSDQLQRIFHALAG